MTAQVCERDLTALLLLSRFAGAYYLSNSLFTLPRMGLTETPLPQPESISEPVLSHSAATPAGAAASPEKRG